VLASSYTIMRFALIFLVSLFVIQESSNSQQKKLLPDSSILFDASKGRKLLEDCSGSELQKVVKSFWTPNPNEYQDLQTNFYKLSNQVKNLNNYLIQYLGIVLEGKKYIYINAFEKSELDDIKRMHQDLKTSAVVVCGGGDGFWRVLFDTNLKEFTELKFNALK